MFPSRTFTMESDSVEVVREDDNRAMDSLCRICACFSELLMPIFEGEGLENNLPEKLKKHLPIKVKESDHLPLKICYQCASTVLSWHDLVSNCLEADKRLKIMSKPVDQFKNSPSEDSNDIELSEVQDPEEMLHSLSEDVKVPLSDTEPTSPSVKPSLDAESTGAENASDSAGAASSARFIDLTEDDSSEAEESNTVSFQFGPESDHCYTRVPSSEPSAASKSVNTDSSRSHQIKPLLSPRSKSNTTSLLRPRSSTANESSIKILKDQICLSPKKTPVFLVCTKSQRNAKGSAKKAILVPLKSVKEAVASKKSMPPTQRPKPLVKSPPLKSQPLKSQPLKSQHLVRSPSLLKPISSKITLLNGSVSITPVPKSSVKPVEKSVEIKPSVTILPVTRKSSSLQNRIVLKSLLTGEKSVRFKCSLCNAEFLHEVVRRMHLYRSHGVKPYKCSVCSDSFGMVSKLKAHMREKHASARRSGPDMLRYACNLCDASFLWYRDMLRHKRENHAPPMRTVPLRSKTEKKVVAGVEVSDKEKEMLNDFHTKIDGQDWYHCKECMKSWKSRDKAILHIRTHTKERMYACEVCDQKFNTPGVLKRHLQVHGGKKPFQCEYCDKSFSSKQNRDDHHRFHTKEVKTVCESCGEFLTSASMLYYHRKIHSGVNPYVCPYCNKAYAIRALLKRHIRFHTGEKPHLCSVCGRGFFTSGQLRGHSLVHTDVRPFSCDKCGAKMKSTKYLNRHKAICQVPRKK